MPNMRNDIKTGVSVAASWAWGTSLIVGMQIAQQKGLGAWCIWGVANALTLAFFGWLTGRGILGRHIFGKRWIKVLALVIQCFCLVIQMNIIFEVLKGMGLDTLESYTIASGIGIVFTLWMYRHGLPTSIWTDCWQWGITMLAIAVIIGLGVWQDVPHVAFPKSASGDILWGIWSACILFAGPIGDVQHWQRADVTGCGKAFYWGSVFFGIYMLLVLVMAHFQFNHLMNIVLLLAVLCVTSSTIDSIAVAMHEISNKRVGTAVAILICIFWGVFSHMGIIELWSKAGVFRVGFALLILCMAFWYRRNQWTTQSDGVFNLSV